MKTSFKICQECVNPYHASWVLQAIGLTLNHYYLFCLKKLRGDMNALGVQSRECYYEWASSLLELEDVLIKSFKFGYSKST